MFRLSVRHVKCTFETKVSTESKLLKRYRYRNGNRMIRSTRRIDFSTFFPVFSLRIPAFFSIFWHLHLRCRLLAQYRQSEMSVSTTPATIENILDTWTVSLSGEGLLFTSFSDHPFSPADSAPADERYYQIILHEAACTSSPVVGSRCFFGSQPVRHGAEFWTVAAVAHLGKNTSFSKLQFPKH